ncbi:phosphatidic acid phosphatase type 2/haloperoxidase [Lipomyces tetrasporus]|uniref:Phosphatidic acid phosphatase type 2/haloperoxidase n=1 Tax=Lipomyces tetrasporus TaxID=54092 RepID=A0AAD7QZ40_9ASCO|nr:phosphatidic acid phosphatase type 2/haloperoxidase [Lipomyces tetrasporus]KAJ8104120.1 phosphatidic acid phosphatase type 2/haloperoxidase [Lipomyces tetrasporus]
MAFLRKTADCLERWSPVLHQFYIVDWFFILFLIGGFLVLTEMTPFQTMFTLDDPSIQHPYATTERVTSINGVIFSTVISIGIVVLFVPFLHRNRNWAHVMNVSLLSLALSLILTEFVTEMFKNFIGRIRPDFIARCMPAPGTPLHGLVGIEVCTNPNFKVISDGFRSTPSGHTSNAFAGLGWLSAWVAGQLRVFRRGTELFRTMLAMLPLFGALVIALSRIEDYRHHITDVLFGGILGVLVAWYSYRKFFPHLGKANCNVPFPPPEFNEKIVVETDYYDSLDEMESGTQKPYSD